MVGDIDQRQSLSTGTEASTQIRMHGLRASNKKSKERDSHGTLSSHKILANCAECVRCAKEAEESSSNNIDTWECDRAGGMFEGSTTSCSEDKQPDYNSRTSTTSSLSLRGSRQGKKRKTGKGRIKIQIVIPPVDGFDGRRHRWIAGGTARTCRRYFDRTSGGSSRGSAFRRTKHSYPPAMYIIGSLLLGGLLGAGLTFWHLYSKAGTSGLPMSWGTTYRRGGGARSASAHRRPTLISPIALRASDSSNLAGGSHQMRRNCSPEWPGNTDDCSLPPWRPLSLGDDTNGFSAVDTSRTISRLRTDVENSPPDNTSRNLFQPIRSQSSSLTAVDKIPVNPEQTFPEKIRPVPKKPVPRTSAWEDRLLFAAPPTTLEAAARSRSVVLPSNPPLHTPILLPRAATSLQGEVDWAGSVFLPIPSEAASSLSKHHTSSSPTSGSSITLAEESESEDEESWHTAATSSTTYNHAPDEDGLNLDQVRIGRSPRSFSRHPDIGALDDGTERYQDWLVEYLRSNANS